MALRRLIAILVALSAFSVCSTAVAAAPRPPRAAFEELRVTPGHFEIYGVIFDHGLPAHWRIEWGPRPAVGHVAKRTLDERSGDRQIVAATFPIKPGRRYYFRIVAFNSAGRTFSRERHFKIPHR